MSKRAVLYTRVSTVDQNLQTQLLDLEQLAAQRGYEIVHAYEDRISGAKSRRPGLEELMRDLTDLVSRARAGSLRSSEMSDPTITVTNLGDKGVDTVFGVIYPPQVALVGFGKPAERVCAVDGGIRIGTVMQATLAADHRASDGHRGAMFLNAIDEFLQQPDVLEK